LASEVENFRTTVTRKDCLQVQKSEYKTRLYFLLVVR